VDRPLNVVFIGAFKEQASDGAVGGTLVASRSLIQSELSDHVKWRLIDSTSLSVPAPPLSIRILLAARRYARALREILRHDTDAVLIFSGGHLGFFEKGSVAVIASWLGRPVVFCPRSGLVRDEVNRSRFMRGLIPFVMKRCSKVICQGDQWKQFYVALTGLPEDMFEVVLNWIDTSQYRMPSCRMHGRGDPVNILYMGWLERYKGIFDLIEAAALAKSESKDVRYVICGRGAESQAAREHAKRLGVGDLFDFKGWVVGQEKTKVLVDADIFVLPSHSEGMPNALLEAMSSGLAVIATRVGGIPDIIRHNENGLLVDPRRPEQLAEAIRFYLRNENRRAEVGRAARATIESRHDIRIIWPAIYSALQRAAAR
jgi:glycosyltransferase involved in cell wall biosynthesis